MLTSKAIENAKPREKLYRLFDGQGLYLEVVPKGGKYWRFKYRFAGKEKRLALGVFPAISLTAARDRREQARKNVAEQIDPAAIKRERKQAAIINAATTFELVAREWHENKKSGWSSPYAKEVLHRMEMDLFNSIGGLPIADIDTQQILSAIRKIENRGAHEIARRTLQYCGQIVRYAIITGRRKVGDPTFKLGEALKPVKHGHFAAIEIDEIPEFLRAVEKNNARLFRDTRNALRLMMLTFVRTNELIKARWNEISFDNALWIKPADSMKMRRPHIIPLSHQAMAILRDQYELTGNWECIFPNKVHPKKHMSNNTILKALERLGYKGRMTGHGFRPLAMSAIKERLGYRHEVIDRQLAHAPGNKVDAAYDRALFLVDRRRMMQEWADYLDKILQKSQILQFPKIEQETRERA